MIAKMHISGYRGFRQAESIEISVQNGSPGSGITVITAPNNFGKSSILECMRARSGNQNVSFTAGTRNSVPDFVDISYEINENVERLKSVSKGSSETARENVQASFSMFVLPSRRAFNSYFGKLAYDRNQYLSNSSLPAQRSSMLTNFEYRLFNILKKSGKI